MSAFNQNGQHVQEQHNGQDLYETIFGKKPSLPASHSGPGRKARARSGKPSRT